MSFLNLALAFGSLAFVIPLAIHLLFRNRFETVDWGAMHLLADAVDANRRRFQWSDWLLLILRCLIPIILAICLARPVVTGWSALPGDAPQTFVLVVDDSRSMSATEPNDVVRLEKAKQQLTQFLQQQSRRDEVMVIPASASDEMAAKMGIQAAITKINSLVAHGGPVDVGRLINAGVAAANEASHPHRQVVIVSDFQSAIVDDAAIEAVDMRAIERGEQGLRPTFSFWNIANDTERLQNVSVDAIDVDTPAVVAQRKTPLAAKIRNASDIAVRNLRVVWSINGEAVQVGTINVEPRATAVAQAMLAFDQADQFEVSVAIEYEDSLVSDNQRRIIVDVLSEVNVLLVNGDPSHKPMQGETDYLAIALSPFSFHAESSPDAIRTEIVSPNQFNQLAKTPANELSRFQVVVLANVKELSVEQRTQLASFVHAGGGLIIFDGDQVDVESYNQPWGQGDAAMRLPAVLGPRIGATTSRRGAPFRIGQLDRQYSPWQWIGDEQPQPMRDVEVIAYRKLSFADDESAARSRVLLTLAGGDPLVVMSALGRGRMAQFAIPCDAAWSTLPLRPVFVPFMHQLVMDFAGNPQSVRPAADDVPPIESELRDVNPTRLQALAESLQGHVYQDAEAFQTADQTRRFGREVWRWLLVAVLVALIVEVLLQQRRVSSRVTVGAR